MSSPRGAGCGRAVPPLTDADIDRFWGYIQKSPNSCWTWIGSVKRGKSTKCGYGRMKINNQEHLAHRIAWTVAFGAIPAGLVVRHRCDNRLCVRFDHLCLGTQKDNVRDAMRRGKHHYQIMIPHSRIGKLAKLLGIEEAHLLECLKQVASSG